MHWYLEATNEAATALIALIARERQSGDILEEMREAANRKRDFMFDDFRGKDLNDDFDERQVMHAYGQAYRAHQEVEGIEGQIATKNAKRAARASSYAAICGALLQIAKQGISAQYGERRDNAPQGRLLGSEPLRNVIWEGRNESMHFETPDKVGPTIRTTFSALEATSGLQFHLAPAPADLRNLAGEIIELLEWWKYENYVADMSTFLI